MDLFDPDKKKQGGLMEATKRLKAQGLKSGGKAEKRRERKAGPRQGIPGLAPIGPRPSKKKLTPQEKLDLMNKIKKSQGKMVDESLKVDNFGNFYYEVKKGGRIKKFPDLSGDGKVTMKDILMGRGVIKKPQKKKKGGFTGRAGVNFDADNKLRRALKRIADMDTAFKRRKNNRVGLAGVGGSMGLAGGKLKGVKDAPEERARERSAKQRRQALRSLGTSAAVKGIGKVAGRLAKRGYGKARK